MLTKATQEMKKYYDCKRQPDDFKIGDLVYLSTKDLSTDQPSKKLDYKQVRPFPIIAKCEKPAYELKPLWTYQVHLVYPVVNLLKAHANEWDHPCPKVMLELSSHMDK